MARVKMASSRKTSKRKTSGRKTSGRKTSGRKTAACNLYSRRTLAGGKKKKNGKRTLTFWDKFEEVEKAAAADYLTKRQMSDGINIWERMTEDAPISEMDVRIFNRIFKIAEKKNANPPKKRVNSYLEFSKTERPKVVKALTVNNVKPKSKDVMIEIAKRWKTSPVNPNM